MDRKYDVVVWGATGFTGRLVAEYLNRTYGTDKLSWAMAGRSQEKLDRVSAQIGAADIPKIVADSHDRSSLDAMVAQTRVVCTTVGPYAMYGSDLVEACIHGGADYCDLSGETQWIYRMIDQYHDIAQSKGVRIVNSCGFDSVPSDLGVYYLQKAIEKDTGTFASQIKMRVKAMKGGMSGGTYASLSNVMAEARKDPTIFKILQDPYSLNPQESPRGKDKRDLQTVKFDKDADSWIAPFVMAGINTRIVPRLRIR